MKIVVGSWFSLPRLGSEAYSSLVKTGVKYESGMGFMLTPDCDLASAVRIIRRAVGGEVQLSVRCVVCLKEACPDCPYEGVCDRRLVSPLCLCEEHHGQEGAYDLYVRTVAAGLAE